MSDDCSVNDGDKTGGGAVDDGERHVGGPE